MPEYLDSHLHDRAMSKYSLVSHPSIYIDRSVCAAHLTEGVIHGRIPQSRSLINITPYPYRCLTDATTHGIC